MKSNKYYSLEKSNNEANLYIFGDITSWEWIDSDVSSYSIIKELQELNEVNTINVFINSYGGEVAEGLAIYNALRNHKAKVKTYCYGFACSIASVIFMAGEERIMANSSMLMIHNPWQRSIGNSKELRKQADDLDKIAKTSIDAYMSYINITEDELKELLDEETWLNPTEALNKNFATSIESDNNISEQYQSSRNYIYNSVFDDYRKQNKIENKIKKEETDLVSVFLNAIK